MRTLKEPDYTIGWICALQMELTAGIAMLDERHHPLPQAPEDDNCYVLGKIDKHNIVMACLPQGDYGTNSAAHVVTQMKRSFRFIKLGLMVGIGGGAPGQVPTQRLGDVVVSTPTGQSSGVLQYDKGKDEPGGFVRKGFMNAPPLALRTAVTAVMSQHSAVGHNTHFSDYVDLAKNQNLPPEFTYPTGEVDQLFMSDYPHVAKAATCETCDLSKLVIRDPRDSKPVVHYGTIASGNMVMKNGIKRDELAAKYGLMCFEMEAAGLMNTFSCLIVRGISDYSDSHKNTQWQKYAAATAAAYCKELLTILPGKGIATQSHIPVSPVQSGPSRNRGYPTSSASFLSIFTDGYLTREQVALGRFVLNIKFPGQDYCPHGTIVTPKDIATKPFNHVREIVARPHSGRFESRIAQLFWTRDPAFDDINTRHATTYQLLNSAECFKRSCANQDTRKWLEQHLVKGAVSMVVGLHTVKDAAVNLRREAAKELSTDTLSAGTGSGEIVLGGDSVSDAFFIAPDERIVAVQYRKIQFKVFSTKTVDKAFLENSNCWKFYGIGRGDGIDDGVEATLQDTTSVDEFTRVAADGSYQTEDGQEVFTFLK